MYTNPFLIEEDNLNKAEDLYWKFYHFVQKIVYKCLIILHIFYM